MRITKNHKSLLKKKSKSLLHNFPFEIKGCWLKSIVWSFWNHLILFISYSFLFDQIFWKCCGLRNTVCSKKDDASMLVYNDIRLSLHASWSEFLSLCFITFLKWTTAILKLIKSDKDATNEETINDLDVYNVRGQ